MRVGLLLIVVMTLGCAAGDEALANHLSRTGDAGEPACAQLAWPTTTAVLTPLPESDRVVTLAHRDGAAACGFGTHSPEDGAEATERALPAAVVIVTRAHPDAETEAHPDAGPWAATTMAGREVLYRSTTLEGLGLEGDVRVATKTLTVGGYALTAAVTTGHTAQVAAGDLLDAVAVDLGL